MATSIFFRIYTLPVVMSTNTKCPTSFKCAPLEQQGQQGAAERAELLPYDVHGSAECGVKQQR